MPRFNPSAPPQFHLPAMALVYHPSIMVPSNSNQPIAMQVRSGLYHFVPQQEYWLLDLGATNHMTSNLFNLQMATPYSSNETVTSASGEGLAISHIGSSCFNTHSHQFKLNFVFVCSQNFSTFIAYELVVSRQ